MRDLIRNYGHRWIVTLLITWSAAITCLWIQHVRAELAPVLAVSGVWITLCVLLDREKGRKAVLWVTGITALAAIIIFQRGIIVAAFTGENLVFRDSPTFSAAVMTSAVGVAAFYILKGPGLRGLYCGEWLVLWIYCTVYEHLLPVPAIAMMVPVLLFTLSQLSVGMGERDRPVWTGLAAMLLVFSLVVLLPSSEEPYPYPLLSRLTEQLRDLAVRAENAVMYREQEESYVFSVSFNGAADNPTLDNRPVGSGGKLLAVPQNDHYGAFYLVGSVWDTFSGGRWYSNADSEMLDPRLDTGEKLYALYRIDGDPETFIDNNVFITYDKMGTKTLFTALNTLYIRTDTDRYPFSYVPGGAVFDYAQSRDTWYNLHHLSESPSRIDSLVEASEGYRFGNIRGLSWAALTAKYGDRFAAELDPTRSIEETLAERESMIFDVYASVPEELSVRTCALALEITEGCETDYERIRAVESYLHDNYSYTLTPRPAPAGENVVDWLLFTTREGYCTWYATAAATLLRVVGVPTRYVQGYRAELTAEVTTEITSDNAHAWCQAYVKGYGWVTVEATPGYSAVADIPAGSAPAAPSGGAGEYPDIPMGLGEDDNLPGIDETDDPEEEHAGELEVPDPNEDGPIPIPEKPDPEEPEEGEVPAPEGVDDTVRNILVAVLAGVLLVLAVAALIRELAGRKYREADYSGKALMDLERAMKKLRRRGYKRRTDETLREFFSQISWTYAGSSRQTAQRALEIYEKLLFAEKKIGREEWEITKGFADGLRK